MADEPRMTSVPEGRAEYEEEVIRWIFADGTIMDIPPVRLPVRRSFGEIIEGMATVAPRRPPGSTRVILRRTVTTVATPWREVVPDVSDAEGELPGD